MAQSYLMEWTTAQNRVSGMALFGGASGMGFVLGPALGAALTPIGTPELNLKNPYFAESLVGVENFGDYENISLEKMLELQPDLIFHRKRGRF